MNRQLGKNIGFLGISQAANYLLPLATIPYITRVVGPENYGRIEFATVSVLFFSAIVTYGFTFTATRKIAELKDDFRRISMVYSTVMQAKLLLLIISTILFVFLLTVVPEYNIEWKIMLFAFPFVIGWGIYPDFLFQGRQDLGVIAGLNFGIKLLSALLIFTILREEADFYLVCGINSFAQISASLVSLLYAHKRYKELIWHKVAMRLVRAYLKSGFYVFCSHFFTRVSTFGIIIFLAFLLPAKELGLFSAAMKLIVVGQSFLFTPVGGALFPYLAKLAKEDLTSFYRERRKYAVLMLLVTSLASGVIMIWPAFFVNLVFGEEYLSVAPILQLMAPVFILTAISHFAMKQGLMVLKVDSYNLWVVLIGGVSSILLNWFLIDYSGLRGAAWAKLGVEALMAISALFFYNRAKSKRLLARPNTP
jgi:PST family polysaccharide transporter